MFSEEEEYVCNVFSCCFSWMLTGYWNMIGLKLPMHLPFSQFCSTFFYKIPPQPRNTNFAYKKSIISQLFTVILKNFLTFTQAKNLQFHQISQNFHSFSSDIFCIIIASEKSTIFTHFCMLWSEIKGEIDLGPFF